MGLTSYAMWSNGLKAAKTRAKYLLTDAHARGLETTHGALGTRKVEVQESQTGDCLWDMFMVAA